jgi:hypothetical protein
MTQQVIITNPINSGLGDTLKVAFDKCNNNFNDLYGAAGGLVNSVSLNDTSTSPIYVTSPAGPAAGVVAETITLKTQTANLVFAGPSGGGPAQPTFRALVAADLGGAVVSTVSLNDNSATPIYTTSPTVASSGAVAETITLNTQTANRFFAGPSSGGVTQPTFRAIVAADISSVVSGLVSVGLADISSTPIYTVTNSPQTNGTIDIALLAQSAALVFAGPISGAAAQPSFRALAMSDLPTSTISDSLMAWMAA